MIVNQNNDFFQIKKLTEVKNLILTSAIMSTIFAIPYVGMVFGMIFQMPVIALIVIICICLKKMRNSDVSILGLIIALIASGISILGYFCFLIMIVIVTNSRGIISDTNRTFYVLCIVLGLVAWLFYVAAAIILFIEFSKINKKLLQMQQFNSNTMTSRQPVFMPTDLSVVKEMPKFEDEASIPIMTAVSNDVIKSELQTQTSQSNELEKSVKLDGEIKHNPFHTPNKRNVMEEKDNDLFSNGWIEE